MEETWGYQENSVRPETGELCHKTHSEGAHSPGGSLFS